MLNSNRMTKTVSIVSFLARGGKHFNEITLVSNKSASRITVLSMVVN